MRRKIDNLIFIVEEDFISPFSVGKYTFYPRVPLTAKSEPIRVLNSNNILNNNRQHKQSAYVEYTGQQENSLLFPGGLEGDQFRPRKRKFIDDILLLGSILTSRNWGLFSRRNTTQYPIVSRSCLEYISKDANQCKQHLDIAFTNIKDIAWQQQFNNGFHLRMLFNHANILNTESRFLSMVVIWEWLYPHLKNPSGAKPSDESNNLIEIFSFILKTYWPQKFHTSLESGNIFHVLRNQLAHSGQVPIDRSYAPTWMTGIPWKRSGTTRGISDYLKFFDRLTQIVVLKTFGVEGEKSLEVFNFSEQLDSFLTTGKL